MPWSMLHQPYVKAAILSTYLDNPCGQCRRRGHKKKLRNRHKHKSKKKLNTDIHKNIEVLKTRTTQPQIFTTEVQESTTLSPVVEMPDGTIPIRITYQNPHVHIVDGKEKEFKLVELQTGNPKYHGHPDEKTLHNIIYNTKGLGEIKSKLKQNVKSKVDDTKKVIDKYETRKKLGNTKSYKIIDNIKPISLDSRDGHNQMTTNTTGNVKLVIQKKINSTVIPHEKSIHPKGMLPQNQENKFKQYNNKFGDIIINVRKKCHSSNCLDGPVKNKELASFEIKKQFDKISENKTFINVTTETYIDIKHDDIKQTFNNLSTNNPLDIKTSPISINKTSSVISNNFKNTDVNNTIINVNMKTNDKNITSKVEQNNENHKMVVLTTSLAKNIIQNTTLVSTVEEKTSESPVNKQSKTQNEGILVEATETNKQNVSSHSLQIENVTEPNVEIIKGNLTKLEIETKKTQENISTELNFTTTDSTDHAEPTSTVDDSSDMYVDYSLYNDISQEKSNEFKDQKNDDKLLDKMAAHYRQLLPWVNYTLSRPTH